MTRIPVGGFPYPPKTWEWISIWFPFVGALIGVLQTIVWLALNDYSDPTRAIIAVIIGVVVTGGFHEDGLKSSLKLLEKFNEEHSFQTNIRGIKVRGSYPSQQEAELRCKMLREIDPNHDVYVGPVGLWMPFHPEAYQTGKVEYMEDELNQLMHEKKKNEEKAKHEFDKRVQEAKVKAMEDNKKKAIESGNVLTQTMNKDGDLVNVKNVSNIEDNLGDNVSAADIRKELFEGDNVVVDKNSDHGRSTLTVNTIEINGDD